MQGLKSVVWLSKTLAILNNSFYASLRVGAEIVHAVQPGHTVRFWYISFLIKYTNRCTIIIANTVQYVRDKNRDLEPKAVAIFAVRAFE